MSQTRRACCPALLLTLCLGGAAQAAPADPDFETVVPAGSLPTHAPSPLVIVGHPAGPLPWVRLVLRDGSVMVGQVLGSDGRLYALRLPHGTALVRRDFVAAATPVRATGVGAGARY